MDSPERRSKPYYASGCRYYLVFLPPRTGKPDTVISFPPCRLNFPHAGARPPGKRTDFLEEVIRENLDIDRPKQVQLILSAGLRKAPPGPFRTRVITDGVIPSLRVDYKGTRIQQYHKEGRALQTETTIHNTRDFQIR